MSIRVAESDDGKTVTMFLPEKFDFSVHTGFRQSYENSSAKNFIVDLKNTSYMDSAALGMLLQLLEHAGNQKSAISIKNSANNIREILGVANFNQLMQID